MMTHFFLETMPGLVLLAVLIVLGICLAAVPFVILSKLVRMTKALEEIGERERRRTETLETINRNIGQLLLHLPRMLKDANTSSPDRRTESAGTPPRRTT